MMQADTGKDSREGRAKGPRWWLVGGGALAVAMLVVGLALSTTNAQAQEVGAIYSGEIEMVGDCGGGSIVAYVSEDGMSVTTVFVNDFNADGTLVSGTAVFDPGTISVGADGSFLVTYDASDGASSPNGMSPPDGVVGHTITVSGAFSDNTLTGTLNVSPSICGDVCFTAETVGGQPSPPPPGALPFKGSFEPIFDFFPQPEGDGEDDCGGGDIIIMVYPMVYPDRTAIFSVEVRRFTIVGFLFESFFSQFEPGEFPIDANGNFSEEYVVTSISSARNEGTFDLDADSPLVSGTITVFQTDDPSIVFCAADYGAELQEGTLPVTGSGPVAGSDDAAMLWLVLAAAAAGAIALGGAAWLARRRLS